MRSTTFFSIVALSLLVVNGARGPAVAADSPPPMTSPTEGEVGSPSHGSRADSLIARAQELRFNNDYTGALEVLDRLEALDPEHPRAHFLKAATLLAETFDSGDVRNRERFLREIDRSLELAERLGKRPDRESQAEALLIRGASYGYRGAYDLIVGPSFGTLMDGRRGLSLLNESVERFPEAYDAYMGVGMFIYWRSKMLSRISWLPFVDDRREEGIAMIRVTAEKGSYAREEALGNLILIFIEEHRPQDSLPLILPQLERYPRSRFLLRAAAVAYHQMGELDTANQYYERLRAQITPDLFPHYPNQIHTDLAQAEIAFAQGRLADAARLCQAALSYPIPDSERSRFEESRAKARDLLGKINRQHGERSADAHRSARAETGRPPA